MNKYRSIECICFAAVVIVTIICVYSDNIINAINIKQTCNCQCIENQRIFSNQYKSSDEDYNKLLEETKNLLALLKISHKDQEKEIKRAQAPNVIYTNKEKTEYYYIIGKFIYHGHKNGMITISQLM